MIGEFRGDARWRAGKSCSAPRRRCRRAEALVIRPPAIMPATLAALPLPAWLPAYACFSSRTRGAVPAAISLSDRCSEFWKLWSEFQFVFDQRIEELVG